MGEGEGGGRRAEGGRVGGKKEERRRRRREKTEKDRISLNTRLSCFGTMILLYVISHT